LLSGADQKRSPDNLPPTWNLLAATFEDNVRLQATGTDAANMTPDADNLALPQQDGDIAMRLMVLEMTVAAIAARLPKDDLDEIASLLVFIAKGSDAAGDLSNAPADASSLARASHHAAELLERIAISRKPGRNSGELSPDLPPA
jgi:hypothetical protein